MPAIVFALVLALVAVPVAHAQQAVAPVAEQLRQAAAPPAPAPAELTPPVRTDPSPAHHAYSDAPAAAGISARNFLAIVGGVVLAVALIALLR